MISYGDRGLQIGRGGYVLPIQNGRGGVLKGRGWGTQSFEVVLTLYT